MTPQIRTEEDEQRAIAQYLDMTNLVWCHVPNGGARHRAEGGKLKAQGVKRGVPDILIFTRPRSGYTGVAIEMKREKGGAVSQEQREWLEKLSDQGWKTVVCRGADAAIRIIEEVYRGK